MWTLRPAQEVRQSEKGDLVAAPAQGLEQYHEYRKPLLQSLWLGLTKAYNLFPARELSPELIAKVLRKDASTAGGRFEAMLELRRLHTTMDHAVREQPSEVELIAKHPPE